MKYFIRFVERNYYYSLARILLNRCKEFDCNFYLHFFFIFNSNSTNNRIRAIIEEFIIFPSLSSELDVQVIKKNNIASNHKLSRNNVLS